MPYIKKEDRAKFETSLYSLIKDLEQNKFNEGELNYVISKIFNTAFNASMKYSTANKLMGVLECVKAEFYRRQVAPYENDKIEENGDV